MYIITVSRLVSWSRRDGWFIRGEGTGLSSESNVFHLDDHVRWNDSHVLGPHSQLLQPQLRKSEQPGIDTAGRKPQVKRALCAYHCHAPTRGRVGDYVGICKLFAAPGVGHLTRSYFSVKHTYTDIGTCSIVFSVWTVVTSRGGLSGDM